MKFLLPLAAALSGARAAEQCYSMETHVCSCTAEVCDATKCGTTGGIWSAECPGDPCACDDGVAFVDDAGATHVLPAGATIVAGAMDAVALFHFGLDPARVLATLGERSSSGSNHGGFYYDGNVVYGEMNHSVAEYDPSVFPADPNAAERAFLAAIPGDLSRNCSSSNYYCDVVDVAYLDDNGWPDVLVVGAFYSSLLTEELRNASRAENVTIVELKNSYGDEEGGGEHVRNMVEMTERMEALAVALGLDAGDQSVVEEDKRALCAAADAFQATAAAAHAAGVRAMASYMPYQANPAGVTGAFLGSPDRDPVLSLMQNLGLPVLFNEHVGNYWENRAGDYAPGSGTLTAEGTASASGNFSYHVDFWLYDDRVSLDFLSDQFAEDWPHPAVTAKQYAYWPSNARILSYRHAAEILTIVGDRLGTAERVTPASACTEPAGDAQSRDLGPGQYSCVKVFPIDFCAGPGVAGPEDAAVAGAAAAAAGEDGEAEPEDAVPAVETTKVEVTSNIEPVIASSEDATVADEPAATAGEDVEADQEDGAETLADDSSGASLAVFPVVGLVAASAFILH